MASRDRVVLDVGGTIFHTSQSTLVMSGSGYFEALLGAGGTGEAMRGRKRARVSDDGDAGDVDQAPAPRECFVDRDPELFGSVLQFMR